MSVTWALLLHTPARIPREFCPPILNLPSPPTPLRSIYRSIHGTFRLIYRALYYWPRWLACIYERPSESMHYLLQPYRQKVGCFQAVNFLQRLNTLSLHRTIIARQFASSPCLLVSGFLPPPPPPRFININASAIPTYHAHRPPCYHWYQEALHFFPSNASWLLPLFNFPYYKNILITGDSNADLRSPTKNKSKIVRYFVPTYGLHFLSTEPTHHFIANHDFIAVDKKSQNPPPKQILWKSSPHQPSTQNPLRNSHISSTHNLTSSLLMLNFSPPTLLNLSLILSIGTLPSVESFYHRNANLGSPLKFARW